MIEGSFATDASLTIPALSVVGSSVTDTVDGTCLPNGRYQLTWANGPLQGSTKGVADGQGHLTVDLSTTIWVLVGGDPLDLLCLTVRGDRVGVRSIVP